MMEPMRRLRRLAPVLVLMVLLGTSVPSASADGPLAISGGVTSLTPTSAVLNGAVSVSALAPASWAFQWGTTTAYGHTTPIVTLPAATGMFAVGKTITGLKPGTTYHFRLVARQLGPLPVWGVGDDLTFVTPMQTGYASAGTHRLAVHSGVVTVPIICTGPRGSLCAGLVVLTAHHVVCGGGYISLRAGSSRSWRWSVSKGCRGRLLRARQHRIGGTLGGSFVGQRPLRTSVVLTSG